MKQKRQSSKEADKTNIKQSIPLTVHKQSREDSHQTNKTVHK